MITSTIYFFYHSTFSTKKKKKEKEILTIIPMTYCKSSIIMKLNNVTYHGALYKKGTILNIYASVSKEN